MNAIETYNQVRRSGYEHAPIVDKLAQRAIDYEKAMRAAIELLGQNRNGQAATVLVNALFEHGAIR